MFKITDTYSCRARIGAMTNCTIAPKTVVIIATMNTVLVIESLSHPNSVISRNKLTQIKLYDPRRRKWRKIIRMFVNIFCCCCCCYCCCFVVVLCCCVNVAVLGLVCVSTFLIVVVVVIVAPKCKL